MLCLQKDYALYVVVSLPQRVRLVAFDTLFDTLSDRPTNLATMQDANRE